MKASLAAWHVATVFAQLWRLRCRLRSGVHHAEARSASERRITEKERQERSTRGPSDGVRPHKTRGRVRAFEAVTYEPSVEPLGYVDP